MFMLIAMVIIYLIQLALFLFPEKIVCYYMWSNQKIGECLGICQNRSLFIYYGNIVVIITFYIASLGVYYEC